ncbi:MAG: site-2 protease family protein [Clostridia bacterium]|nr:site-2 protease family protein [Clostridia bacterium]
MKRYGIEVKRNGKIKTFEAIPQIQTIYKIGVTFSLAQNTFINNIYYGFWDTVDFSTSIIDNLKMLFRGSISIDQLTGPIGISEAVSKTKGIIEFVYLMALISLSLGVTNLLPFPPLDGGKIVILIIEWIRRKPIKEELEAKIQIAGFCLLIGLSIYVTYNDILRIF